MLLVALFGAGMLGFGLFMFLKPERFACQLMVFSQKSWFHGFEIATRFVIGLMFLLVANLGRWYLIVEFLGWLLCFVSLFLVLIGEHRHRRFAQLTVKLGKGFRYVGIFAIFLGTILIMVSL